MTEEEEELREIYEKMKAEMEEPYSWMLNDFNDNYLKFYKELKQKFEK